jgi:transcriptional regulator with XRE-family HTH domain
MICSVEIVELGRRLKARRTATGRTIASVAAEAGLSVPYIANLENGRGNPTLSALTALAAALGAPLRIEWDTASPARRDDAALPESLVRFARLPRFDAEAAHLAVQTGQSTVAIRERLLTAMAGVATVYEQPLTELDWHRVLDALVLIGRAR